MKFDPRDPIVVDPPGFDPAAGWKECKEYVERCGGLSHSDGSPNWRAAFGADPGICSCPACRQMHWAFGRRHRCTACGFEYPTDWWPMYSWGVSAARRSGTPPYRHEERMSHPYYRYGYEHPVEDAWAEHDKIDWPAVLAHTPTATDAAGSETKNQGEGSDERATSHLQHR